MVCVPSWLLHFLSLSDGCVFVGVHMCSFSTLTSTYTLVSLESCLLVSYVPPYTHTASSHVLLDSPRLLTHLPFTVLGCGSCLCTSDMKPRSVQHLQIILPSHPLGDVLCRKGSAIRQFLFTVLHEEALPNTGSQRPVPEIVFVSLID